MNNSTLKRRSIKVLKIALITLPMIFILILNVPIPIRIETYALEVMLNDPYHVIERTVTIRGWYSINMRSNNEFRGQIIISGSPETDAVMRPLNLHPTDRPTGYRFSFLMYESVYEEHDSYMPLPIPIVYFGAIYVRGVFDFGNAMILRWSEGNGEPIFLSSPVIVLGAATREEAVSRILNALDSNE